MKLADMQDLGSCAARRVGSTPIDRRKIPASMLLFKKYGSRDLCNVQKGPRGESPEENPDRRLFQIADFHGQFILIIDGQNDV